MHQTRNELSEIIELNVIIENVELYSLFPKAKPIFMTVQVQESQQPSVSISSQSFKDHQTSSSKDQLSLSQSRLTKCRTDIFYDLVGSQENKPLSLKFRTNKFSFQLHTMFINQERYCLFEIALECYQDSEDRRATLLARGNLSMDMNESKILFVANKLDYVVTLRDVEQQRDMMRLHMTLDIQRENEVLQSPTKLHALIHNLRLSSEVQLELMKEANDMKRSQQQELYKLFEEELSYLREANKQLMEEIKLKNGQIETLERYLNEEKEKTAKMKLDLAQMNTKLSTYKNEIQVFSDDKLLIREYKNMQKQCHRMKELEREREVMIHAHQEQSQQSQRLMKKIERYKSYRKTIQEQEKVINKLEELLKKKYFDPQSYDSMIESDELQKRANRIKQLETEQEELKKELVDNEKNRQILEQKVVELGSYEKLLAKRDVDGMSKDLSEYKVREEEQKNELESLRTETLAMRHSINEKETEIRSLKEQLTTQIEALKQSDVLHQQDEAIKQLRNEKDSMKKENNTMKNEIEQLKSQTMALQRKLDALNYENHDIAKRYIEEMHSMRLKLANINESKEFEDYDFDDEDSTMTADIKQSIKT